MRHAILITAYKDVESIVDLIETMGSCFNYYIHFDRKSRINFEKLADLPNVFITAELEVNWGGVNHFYVILGLIEEALKNEDNDFFHLITGEDFPIKTTQYILKLDRSKSFIKSTSFPFYNWDSSGGHDRYRRYHFYDFFNAKTKFGARLIYALTLLQKIFHIKRKDFSVKKKFGGSTYWSLNREVLGYLLNQLDSDRLKKLRYTFCSEEFVFQTLLEDSPYQHTIVNDNLRFIDWSSKRGGDPAFLDETDFEKLRLSNAIFARKIRKIPTSPLLGLLKKHLKIESQMSENNI
ncbi:beta-1,6-N-acetylglucosaminyltransferase [Sphingobacterium sp. lm-10]|uniref:beta-1,6-N-acetylglucosaminyltransferase n=1 Tax=Sphingobacterium sp. lm-10 TaxID=2944904 RepID=UPI002022386C|nr:beta-1,6-N-acetylglucosaminyltransferase [Sphingobacterium sp. lm-10]MCL7988614.1 beta-1,6-N-acetylglucosaminyltransferase [Sphingobacterium sp. lm-10]